jgi:tRNA (cmo5U34)-methyltransferase
MTKDNASAHPASEYDAQVRRVIPFYDTIQAETLDLVRSVSGGNVGRWLDTGCGTGSFVERAVDAFPQTQFLLTDPSEAMLAIAAKRHQGRERVQLLPPAASGQLDHVAGKGSVDVVTAMLCHHYLDTEGRRVALRGCLDVLCAGGLLVVFENTDAESVSGRDLALKRWGEYQRQQGRSEDDVCRHMARFGTELKPIPVSMHLRLLREVGFKTAEIFWKAHVQAGFFAIKPGE